MLILLINWGGGGIKVKNSDVIFDWELDEMYASMNYLKIQNFPPSSAFSIKKMLMNYMILNLKRIIKYDGSVIHKIGTLNKKCPFRKHSPLKNTTMNLFLSEIV